MPAVAASKVRLDNINGRRGSTFFSVMPRYGVIAPPAARPHNNKVFRRGTLGAAAYLLSSTHGGARNADEVTTQVNINASATTEPRCAKNGSNKNATHDKVVTQIING